MAAAPSAERQRLGELIDGMREFERERDVLTAAQGPAREAAGAATASLDAAKAAVETTARAAVDHRISVLAGGDEAPPASVEDARRNVREAEDRVAAARMARDEIARRIDANASAVNQHRGLVTIAARAVFADEMAPVARTAIVEVRRLQAELLKAWAPLVVLDNAMAKDRREDEVLHRLCNEVYLPPSGWALANPVPPHAPETWSAALAKLEQDATAKLPTR